MHLLADAGACHGSGNATVLDGLCTFVDNHTHSEGLVFLIGRVLWPLLLLGIVIALSRVARAAVARAMRGAGADAQVRTLANNALVVTGIVLAVAAALVAAGLDLSVFLTVGGVSTVVLGLAFQDLLRNVVAGTFLLLERPFKIGDVVTVDGVTGRVRTIDLRTSQLDLLDGTVATLPNLDLFTKRVTNLSATELRRFTVAVWVPADVDTAAVAAAFLTEVGALTEVLRDPAPQVQPGEQVDGGVTLTAGYWLRHREVDPDGVARRLVPRLTAAAEAIRAGHAPDDPPPPPLPAEPAKDEQDPDGEPGAAGLLPGLAARRRRRRAAPPKE